jgi:phosphoribosyl 1,2-cyclic phosphodiesterase
MKVWMLGSGSRGNATVIESGGFRIMVDVGFGPRILKKRLEPLGIAPESIDACIITHEHSDHIRGAARAARKWHWPLFASEGTYAESRLGALGTPAATFQPGRTLEFPDTIVETFRTPHDASEPIGVVVTNQTTGARAAILTDIGCASKTVRAKVKDIDILVIESNHDEQMLWNGSYPLSLQRRIASRVGHLSNNECADLVQESVTPRLRQVVLAHLSEENNTPMLAFTGMREALKKTAFRGSVLPAMQDSAVGPFVAMGNTANYQLSLGF